MPLNGLSILREECSQRQPDSLRLATAFDVQGDPAEGSSADLVGTASNAKVLYFSFRWSAGLLTALLKDPTLVCDECDATHGAGRHRPTHALIKYQESRVSTSPQAAVSSFDARMSVLESSLGLLRGEMEVRFSGAEEKMDGVRDGLAGRITTIDERLRNMENMLQVLMERLCGGDARGEVANRGPMRSTASH